MFRELKNLTQKYRQKLWIGLAVCEKYKAAFEGFLWQRRILDCKSKQNLVNREFRVFFLTNNSTTDINVSALFNNRKFFFRIGRRVKLNTHLHVDSLHNILPLLTCCYYFIQSRKFLLHIPDTLFKRLDIGSYLCQVQ